MTMPRRAAPQLLLLLMIAIWGASYAAVKVALDRGMPPFTLLMARFWLAVLCLLPLLWAQGREAAASERGRGIATGTALLIGYAVQTFGMQETTASMAGFLSGLITLLVAVGAFAVFGERLRGPTILGLLLGSVGLVLLCANGDGGDGEHGRVNTMLGIGLQIGSSTSYAAHILMLSRLSRKGREGAFCWWQLATVAVGVTLLAPLQGFGDTARWAGDPVVWGNVAFLGVFALAIGIAVQSRVQPQIPASQVAVLFATQPGFAAIGGAVFLGDRLGVIEWTGGALIALGVLVAELLRQPAASVANEHRDAARLGDGAQ